MLELEFENRIKNFKCDEKLFAPTIKSALKNLTSLKKFKGKKLDGVLRFVLTNDAAIQKLNKQYRGLNKPTDVLSFSYFEGEKFPGDDTVGEVVISVDTAKKQAKEHQKTLHEELIFLFLHGLLHIFGYDHEEDNERKEMFDLQDKILKTKAWRKIIDP